MPGVFLPLAILRIVGGLGLVVGVAAFGYFARPLWVLPVLALIFTISYGFGKWRAWAHAAKTGGLPKALLGQIGTYVVQLIMVAMFYFMGRGVGSLAEVEAADMAFGQSDQTLLMCFAGFALVVGVGLVALDSKAIADVTSPVPHQAASAEGGTGNVSEATGLGGYLNLDPTPLTPETFWLDHHYSNSDHVYDDTKETTLNHDRAFLSDAAIAAEEARLGITLPDTLRGLYAMQNGGSRMALYVPAPIEMNNVEEGWINPFSGYDDMTPLTRVETLHERISAYADEDETDQFPPNSKAMIVLAQWYRETLFLDYRHGDTPRVGFADFDDHEDLSTGDWEDLSLWWDDFDSFFAALRRRDPE